MNPNIIRVKFTKLTGIETRIPGKELWDLPDLSELGSLPDERTVLPSWIVRLFFGGGALWEVYTDNDLRIAFGSNGRDLEKDFIYVMQRVK